MQITIAPFSDTLHQRSRPQIGHGIAALTPTN
jgi:hypothetical protein